MENTKDMNFVYRCITSSGRTINRPVDCAFLDECLPHVFWCSRKGAERDFPDCVIKQYDLNEFIKYLEEKKLQVKNIEFNA